MNAFWSSDIMYVSTLYKGEVNNFANTLTSTFKRDKGREMNKSWRDEL